MPHRVVVPTSGRVLVVEDDPALAELLREGLENRGHAAEAVVGASDALGVLEERDFEVVITDMRLSGSSGVELCRIVAERRPDIPVVMITGFGSMETAIEAIRAGAYDFLVKPVEIDALEIAVRRALQHRALRQEIKRLRHELDISHGFEELVGESAPMQQLRDLLGRIAESETSVLITGESGTGKEVVARAIHAHGPRRERPFVAINCAAMPEPLLESELFGHVRGAFTDAKTSKTGLFVQANGGTIFLDEIGDMPVGLQPKLLRVLQDRRVRPVGSTSEVPIDVRVLAATNRDLEEAVDERRFRQDLYFRINVIHVELPPLRARGTDVLLLAQRSLEVFAKKSGRPVLGITASAAEKLVAYDWPGNVRELQNAMERAVALARFDQIRPEDLPERVRNYKKSYVVVASDDPSELVPMEEVERRYVLRVLAAVNGNKATAARVLGFDRKTLYRKLERWGKADGESIPPASKG
jgi:two-component system response regulator HydG